jgi:pyruvate dehydrogenase E2 component (dihydrolipoamide acetyltransferase)
MTAGRLVSWHKRPGDAVQRGDIVAEVETEKGIIDVEIFTSGIIEKLLVKPGEMVPVGTPLALLREPGQPAMVAAAPPVLATSVPVSDSAQATVSSIVGHRTAPSDANRLRISPAARRRARELGVDPATINGTGRGGAISIEDIEAASTAKPAAASQQDRYAQLRRTIAAAMSRSKREIPHFYLSTTIDMDAALQWMTQQNERQPITERLLPAVLLIKAVALALREVPELNAVWEGDKLVIKSDIHVGLAIALRQGGLVAPAIHNADQLTLFDLMSKFRDLVNRTRAGSLRSSELSDPTVTITSLGEQGVEAVYGVIYPPQVAMIGFGKIVERPWSINRQILSRSVVTATLSADHRVADGHRGAQLLSTIDHFLQEPKQL